MIHNQNPNLSGLNVPKLINRMKNIESIREYSQNQSFSFLFKNNLIFFSSTFHKSESSEK